MIRLKALKPRKVKPDDPLLRNEYVARKWIAGIVFVVWTAGVVSMWVWYHALPIFLQILGIIVLTVLTPDLPSLKVLFLTFEDFQKAVADEEKQ